MSREQPLNQGKIGARWWPGWCEKIGYGLRVRFGVAGDLLGLLVLSLKQARKLRQPSQRHVFWILFKRQLYNSGFRATSVNCALALLLGGGFTAQALGLVQKLESYADIYVIVIVMELAPLLSGIILIARSATAVTSEIGHLQLNDEFEVLSAQGISPLFLFMLPILFAFPVSLLIMLIYFNVVALLSSWFYIAWFTHADFGFWPLLEAITSRISLFDYLTLTIKAVVGGVVIALVSLHSGWQVGDRFTDIPRAIANSTTLLLLVYFVLNMGLSLMAY